MRAIIIAAGRGRRLLHHTDDRPKCLMDIGGRTILDQQLHAFVENGVEDIHIVRGYRAEDIRVPGATYHANPDWRDNNILESLFCAESAMDGPFLSTYSDILFTPEVVRAVLDAPHDITLVVDREWHRSYEGRRDHPVAQAELTEVDGDRVLCVGKQVGPERSVGEFIGLAHHTARGAAHLREVFADVRRRHEAEPGRPFQAAPSLAQAYQTDLYLELIDRGIHVGWVPIHGQWREIDTVEDLERVRAGWPPG